MNIILIGFNNCGKTSVGKVLAKILARPFIDTDRVIEQHYQRLTQIDLTVREIYQREGEDYFRTLEKQAIAETTTIPDNLNNMIIATGGGCILDKENIQQLRKNANIIYLFMTLAEWTVRNQQQHLPAFIDKQNATEQSAQIYARREPLYAAAADYQIDVAQRSPADIANIIKDWEKTYHVQQ